MADRDCKSITNDNGIEFGNHEYESKKLKVPIYFTTPYSSWEKGTCENTNGLIRQYFNRNFEMEKITYEQTTEVQDRLNNRPRKGLGFRTLKERSKRQYPQTFRKSEQKLQYFIDDRVCKSKLQFKYHRYSFFTNSGSDDFFLDF